MREDGEEPYHTSGLAVFARPGYNVVSRDMAASLEQGLQHSLRDPIDSTPLLHAARQDHLTVLQLLLEYGVLVLE